MSQINIAMPMAALLATSKSGSVGTTSTASKDGFQRLLHTKLDGKNRTETETKTSNFSMDKLSSQVSARTGNDANSNLQQTPDSSSPASLSEQSNVEATSTGNVSGQAQEDAQASPNSADVGKEIAQLLADGKLSKEELTKLSDLLDQVSALTQVQELLAQLLTLFNNSVDGSNLATTANATLDGQLVDV